MPVAMLLMKLQEPLRHIPLVHHVQCFISQRENRSGNGIKRAFAVQSLMSSGACRAWAYSRQSLEGVEVIHHPERAESRTQGSHKVFLG